LNSGVETEVIIIGGGIGGLAAAVALHRVGIQAKVFEQAPELREVGAGLSLWSNAMKAIRRLGVEEAVVAQGSVIERAVTMTADGQKLNEATISDLNLLTGSPSVCIHRADLQKTLAKALKEDLIHLHSTCIGFEQDADGVIAHFADGRSQRGTLLIGADGIHSTVREGFLEKAEPRYAGYLAFRGIAQYQYPGLPPGVIWSVLGRGMQFGILPCGPNHIYWFATMNVPAGSRPTGDTKQEVLTKFCDWIPPVPAVIEATHEAALLRNDIIDRPPTWPWGQGRVTLLGDAIHPSTPTLGQGACQALESAVILAHCLRVQGLQADSLRTYEAARRQRTSMVTKLSWSLGKMYQWEKPLAIWLRTQIMRSQLGQRYGMRLFEKLLRYEVPDLVVL
jgi:2-polyprenyl-6-methoxyphenol hydroxylase-like FAD-dependent oxidoreductase